MAPTNRAVGGRSGAPARGWGGTGGSTTTTGRVTPRSRNDAASRALKTNTVSQRLSRSGSWARARAAATRPSVRSCKKPSRARRRRLSVSTSCSKAVTGTLGATRRT
jgi:hypothetical protein